MNGIRSRLRKLVGLKPVADIEAVKTEAAKPDRQSVDVNIAARRVNDTADQVRAVLAETLQRRDGLRRSIGR